MSSTSTGRNLLPQQTFSAQYRTRDVTQERLLHEQGGLGGLGGSGWSRSPRLMVLIIAPLAMAVKFSPVRVISPGEVDIAPTCRRHYQSSVRM